MSEARKQAQLDCEGPWRFEMRREERAVAFGVMFPDGSAVLRWCGGKTSTAIYASMADLRAVHGHPGTLFEWLDREPTSAFKRAATDCYQDSCENCPFSSIGGLEQRIAPRVPQYIPEADRDEWLRGYLTAAHAMYGDDWRTCSFGWAPAIVIADSSNTFKTTGSSANGVFDQKH